LLENQRTFAGKRTNPALSQGDRMTNTLEKFPAAEPNAAAPARSGATRILFVAATAALATALALPAAAGHGAAKYENPMAERDKRENRAAPGSPSAVDAPATVPPEVVPAAPQSGDRDQAFATATRQHLSEVVRLAEDQLANAKDPQLAATAKSIRETSRKQLADLDRWLATHPESKSDKQREVRGVSVP
jgi:uncharacterized protein (DUF305 family)